MTRFDIATYPLINIQYTIRLYKPSDVASVLEAVVQVQASMEADPQIGMFANFRKDAMAVGLVYADWTADLSHVFDVLYKLEPMGVMVPPTKGSFCSFVEKLAEFHPPEGK